MVGDRPVIVCWGYEKEAAAALLPAALPQPPLPAPAAHRAVLEAPPVPPSLPALRPRRARSSPGRARSLAALPLLLLLLGGAWLLRGCLPADPALTLATREGPPAPPAPAAAARSEAGAQGRLLHRGIARPRAARSSWR